jgi:EAL domain-containing protein (putative c-di-GMP-specific phosphodiesterase class I)
MHGQILPDDFISLAEETGDILPIGAWVLDEAVRQAAAWRRLNASIRVAVNVSPRQIDGGSLIADVTDALERHGVAPQALELEVTESCGVRDQHAAAATMRCLLDMGVGIAIDDFGKGYSGIPTLCWLPATAVKIDKSLVDRLLLEPDQATTLLKSVIAFAHSLGAVAVAEGVETNVQVDALRSMGCDQAQGFRFGRPAPSEVICLDIAFH